jgi:hypothetical protein
MALECYNLYKTNINFMLGRQGDFEQKGRAQDFEESLEIDAAIVNQFETLDIQYIKLESEDNARAAMRYIQRL